MALNVTEEREQLHALVDRLGPTQVQAVRGLLETMLDPVSFALSNAPVDDEPVTDEEARSVQVTREWFKRNEGIPFEQIVAELGFSMEEVKNYRDPS